MRRAKIRNRHYTRERNAVIRGPQVFAALQQAQSQARQNLHELEKSTSDFDSKMDQLVSQRSEEFVELAKHYLPNLSMETIERSFVGVRSELTEIFRRKKLREEEIIAAIDLAQQTILQAQEQTDQVTEQLNKKAEERDQLQEIVSERLKQIPEYETLTNEAALAEHRLSQNEERMEQVHAEATEKMPSYENSRLFMYLYNRKYGTSEYKPRGMIRRMDRWLARYIDFANARQSYNFMQVTPGLMQEELKRRRANFNELMDQIEAMEAKIEQEVGLTAVIEEGDRLGLKRDELVNQIEDQNQQLEAYISELNDSRESKDKHYDDALTRMRKHLEETEEAVLQERAEKTIEEKDDKIVSDIVELNDLIGDLQPEILLLVGKRKSLTDKQAGLDDIVQRFRSSNFDSNRSVFPDDFEIGKFIGRYMNNTLDARSLWKHIRQSQKFQESWAQQTSTDVLNSPSAQVILHTMLDVAREALRNSARRSVYRRSSSRGGGGISWPKFPTPQRRRRSSSRGSSSRRRSTPRRRSGGFTSGDGF